MDSQLYQTERITEKAEIIALQTFKKKNTQTKRLIDTGFRSCSNCYVTESIVNTLGF